MSAEQEQKSLRLNVWSCLIDCLLIADDEVSLGFWWAEQLPPLGRWVPHRNGINSYLATPENHFLIIALKGG
jgi:hypothetical protein